MGPGILERIVWHALVRLWKGHHQLVGTPALPTSALTAGRFWGPAKDLQCAISAGCIFNLPTILCVKYQYCPLFGDVETDAQKWSHLPSCKWWVYMWAQAPNLGADQVLKAVLGVHRRTLVVAYLYKFYKYYIYGIWLWFSIGMIHT